MTVRLASGRLHATSPLCPRCNEESVRTLYYQGRRGESGYQKIGRLYCPRCDIIFRLAMEASR